MKKITFADKVENQGATDDGKVKASNMNELKEAVNENTELFNLPFPFFNDTGVEIPAHSIINAFGVDTASGAVKGTIADSASPLTSSAIIGMNNVAVPDQTIGYAWKTGEMLNIDTSAGDITEGGPLYLKPGGGYTSTRPKYPNTIIILGSCIEKNATTGKILLDIIRFIRRPKNKTFPFTSQGVGSGTYYEGGFYDWATTSATLTQASLTQTHGTAGTTKAGHVGIVPSGPGTVDTGQVGLRVTGTQDSETGPQTGAQTAIITDDITTLTVDVMVECAEKFSGQVTLELYVVSGSPTTYSLTFNYGFSKYEDFFNEDATIASFECIWRGGGNDTGFNIELLHHKATGWTYSASGFVPGNGAIADRLTDQGIDSNVTNGEDGAYKRTNLDTFLDSDGTEGYLWRITTTANNTIQIMYINMEAFSESLT
jgi:hypothetical protein